MDRVDFEKVLVLTFLAYSPLKLDHSFNYKYFLSPPGLLTLAAPYHPQSIVKNIRTNLKFNPHPHAKGDLTHFSCNSNPLSISIHTLAWRVT